MIMHLFRKLNNSELPASQPIDCFFKDQKDYFDFHNHEEEKVLFNEDKTCKAELKKEGNLFLYTLTWMEDGMFIGEYIKPFKANIFNIEKFNFGCKILANRMKVYVKTKNVESIPDLPLAFGNLTIEVN